MKSIISKNIAGALVLAAATLPLASQAAEEKREATVTITATVAEVFNVDATATVNLTKEKQWEEDVTITTNHNTGDKANITIFNTTGEGHTFNLTSDKNTLPVNATINDDDKAVFDKTTHIMTHALGPNANNKKTTLHLKASPADTQMAGTYTGSLTIKINKA